MEAYLPVIHSNNTWVWNILQNLNSTCTPFPLFFFILFFFQFWPFCKQELLSSKISVFLQGIFHDELDNIDHKSNDFKYYRAIKEGDQRRSTMCQTLYIRFLTAFSHVENKTHGPKPTE